jgi:hypothetical protein
VKKELGYKKDEGKLRWSLLPIGPLRSVIRVMAYGANKYSEDNYMNGMKFTRIYDANMRHLTAWKDGEDFDEETGESHIAHAICCGLMLLALILKGYGKSYDDRLTYEQFDGKDT